MDILPVSRPNGHVSAAIKPKVHSHLFADADARAAAIKEEGFAKI
jgi:hypothetical protein